MNHPSHQPSCLMRAARARLAAAWRIGLFAAAACLSAQAVAQVSPDTVVRRMLQEGRYDAALAAADAELKLRPLNGQMLLLKGAALSMSQRKSEAIKVLRMMVDKKVEEASAYNNLAVIYASQGDFEAARSALEWAVRAKPDYVTAHHNLGNVYANLASQSYKNALKLDRSDQSLPAKLAQLGEVLGQQPGEAPAMPSRTGAQAERGGEPARGMPSTVAANQAFDPESVWRGGN